MFRIGIAIGFVASLVLIGGGIGIHSGIEMTLGVALLLLTSFNLWTYRVRTRSTDSD
jgi:hypothetical protein